MVEENEPFYDNNQEISICRIENTPKTPLTGSTPILPSENIFFLSEFPLTTIHRTAGEGGGHFFNSSLTLLSASHITL